MLIRNIKKTSYVLAAILLPGLAHYLLRMPLKGTTLLLSYFFHLLLAYLIYKHQIIQIPLAIVMLLLAFCAHIFYSVFNALQQIEQPKSNKTNINLLIFFVLVLVWGILIIVALEVKGMAELLVNFYPHTFVLFALIYFVTHLKSKQREAIYIGRMTTINCLFVIIGAELFAPRLFSQLQVSIVGIVVVCLYIIELSTWMFMKRLKSNLKLQFDIVSFIVLVIIVVIFIIVPKYGHLPSELLKSYHQNNRVEYEFETVEYSPAALQTISVSVNEEQTQLSITHRNGLVNLKSYDGEYIKIEPTRYNVKNEQFQQLVEQENEVKVQMNQADIHITSLLAEYEGTVSKMDITVYIPYSFELNKLNVNVEHGNIQLEDTNQFKEINLQGGSTHINVLRSVGDIKIKVNKGNVYVFQQLGSINAILQSGHIMLYDILKSIDAETLNGNVLIMNSNFFEPIKVHAGVGSVQIDVPDILDYSVEAKSSFGTISIKGQLYTNEVLPVIYTGKRKILVYADQNIDIN